MYIFVQMYLPTLSIYIDRLLRYNIAILEEGAFNARAPRKGEMAMPASKAQQKAVNKYMAANYDRVNLTMPKGRKDIIQAHAAAQGESVNGFINRAISETMERDSGAPVAAEEG